MFSPIKYFGGKGGMYNDILPYFPNHEDYQTYIEPFGGGASLLFRKEPSSVEIYNDLEQNVYSFF
jgi:DNA adenine methylase